MKRTKDEGIIFNFDPKKGIEDFVDADFAGTWTHEMSNDRTSALSRMGYCVKIENCPVFWVSKMQTKVVLSTTKAEYTSLYQSARDLLPIKNTVEHLNKFMNFNSREINTHSAIFEDNARASQLATKPKFRP